MHSRSGALLEAVHCVLHENDFRRVILQVMHSARKLLNAEAASLFVVNRKFNRLEMVASTNLPARMEKKIHFPMGVGVAGWVAENGKSANVADITKDPRHYTGVTKITGFQTRGYLSVPLKAGNHILGTLQLLNRTRGGRFTRKDQALLEGFSVIAALAMRKSRMHEQALEKRRMQAELAVAQTFQRTLLPETFDPPAHLTVAGFNQPARQMGGDIYDGFHIPNGYCVLVGDVSGKGAGAALWMASLSSLIHFLVDQGDDPLEKIGMIDSHMGSTLPSGQFITMFLASIREDHIRYASAGHNPMLLHRSDGSLENLGATGLPLGIMPELPITVESFCFSLGDRLVLYSDGVVEAEREDGSMYQLNRLERLVKEGRLKTPEELIRTIFRSVSRFAAGIPQADDITLLIVDRK